MQYSLNRTRTRKWLWYLNPGSCIVAGGQSMKPDWRAPDRR